MTCPDCGSILPDHLTACSKCLLGIRPQCDETIGLRPANYRGAVSIVWRDTVSHLAWTVFGAWLILSVANWQRWIAIVLFGIECTYAVINVVRVAVITLATAYLGPLKLLIGLKNRELLKDELYAIGGTLLRIAGVTFSCVILMSIYGKLFHLQESKDENATSRDKQRKAVHVLKPLLDALVFNGKRATKWGHMPIKDIPLSELDDMVLTSKYILKEGSSLDLAALNRVYPQLGTMFSQKCLRSLQVGLEAGRAAGQEKLLKLREGDQLEAEWIKWFNPRLQEINTALRQKW